MTEVPIIYEPIHWLAVQINGLVSIYRDLCYERVNVARNHKTFQLNIQKPSEVQWFCRTCQHFKSLKFEIDTHDLTDLLNQENY